MKLSKKGFMDQFGSLAIAIATFTIVIVVAMLMASNVQTQMTTNSYACDTGYDFNATTHWCHNSSTTYNVSCAGGGVNCTGPTAAYNSTMTLQNATATVPGWVPLIVIVVIGAAVLGLVRVFRQ